MDTLLRTIDETLSKFQTRRQAASKESTKVVLENLESCIRSAHTLVSTTCSNVSGSLISPSHVGPLANGSIRIFTTRAQDDIDNWRRALPPPTIHEHNEDPVAVSDSASTHGLDAETGVTTLSQEDSTMKVMIQHWLQEGKSKFAERAYELAEACLRRAYTESTSRNGFRFDGWEEILNMLVISHCKQGNLEEAKRRLLDISKATKPASSALGSKSDSLVVQLTDILVAKYCEQGKLQEAMDFMTQIKNIKDEKRLYNLDSQRTLAELYFRKGSLEKSQELCLEIDSLRSVLREPDFKAVGYHLEILYEATILLALIYASNEDHVEAGGRKALLPSSYQGTPLSLHLLYITPIEKSTFSSTNYPTTRLPPTQSNNFNWQNI